MPGRRLVKRLLPWLAGAATAVGLADVHPDGTMDLHLGAAFAQARPTQLAKPDPIAELRVFEEDRRAHTDFAALPTGDRASGADPVDLARLPGVDAYVGVLRGRDAVVVLDGRGIERQRLPAPSAPAALAVGADRHVYVAGGASTSVARYRVRTDGTLVRDGELALGAIAAVTDLAVGVEGVVYASEDYGGRLLALRADTPPHEFGRCHGPLRLVREDAYLLVDCLLDHELRVYGVGADGVPGDAPLTTLRHDGPIWSIAAARAGERLVIALGGVEDHELHRGDDGFGFVDSFAFVYELALPGLRVERRRQVNVSELGVVTPKTIAVQAWLDGAIAVEAVAFGSDRRVTLHWGAHASEPEVETFALPPGTVALVSRLGGFVAANPLLDAFVVVDAAQPPTIIPVVDAQPVRSAEERAGELLFFTTLMAPWNGSQGEASRFTCETCHYDGYGDGRLHFTGRADVHATARPLRGLQANRPHFSRALDRSMAQMVDAEFRVAGKGSGKSPWFSLDVKAVPWLRDVAGLPALMSPLWLRRAFMTFLMAYTHRPNPAVAVRSVRSFSDAERHGAELFRDHCERCHEARLVADAPDSRVPFARWEALVNAPEGAIVWGTEVYAKTGVTPYVHELGARVPALRRTYKRFPLFTAGTAPDLAAVVRSARFAGDSVRMAQAGASVPTGRPLFMHGGVGDGVAAGLHGLADDEQAALLTFLMLL